MKLLRLSAIMVLLPLSACDSDKPSSGEIERAIIDFNPACAYIHIQDIKKVNGKKISEDLYSIDAEYRIEVQATSEAKKQYNTYLSANIDQLKQEELEIHKARNIEVESIRQEADKKVRAIDVKEAEEEEWRRCQSRGSNSPECEVVNQKLEERSKIYRNYDSIMTESRISFEAKVKDIRKRISGVESNLLTISSEFKKQCFANGKLNTDNLKLYSDFSLAGYEAIAKMLYEGHNTSVSQTIMLEKTDNGWLLKK